MAADVALQDAAMGDADADVAPPARRLSGRKLVLFILLPILLLGGGAGALLATGVIGSLGSGGTEEDAASQPADPASLVFHDLPEMLVNLNTDGRRASYLKMRISLELGDANQIPALQALAPRIVDNFQVYLRELRTEDLRGSAGMARLREELRRRVGAAVEPIEIRDVLFREMLVQ